MKIKVDKNTFIESDGMQFLIKKYSGRFYEDKDGNEKESYQVLGYYGTIEQTMNGLLNKKILNSKATSFKELLEEIRHAREDIRQVVSGEI